ncbi:MAG: nucleotide pyrophosphatase phosphodiesterase [Trebouxia sp. A1-2]|nr:MAG: nucleotide pyrophosphatase phosphodiesterase [Trebouxia sp. A1-2]
MCASPAKDFDFAPLNLHTFIMTDLEPGEWYEYRLRDSSDTLSFRASPRPGPESQVSFVVYGDMGESYHARAKAPGARATADYVTRDVIDNDVDLVVHVGDLSYANGDPEIWDTFMDYIEPYSSRAPYMIGIGNHEYDYRTGKEKHRSHSKDPSGASSPYDPDWGNYGNDSGGECGVATARRFIMPEAYLDAAQQEAANHGSSVNSPFWYSFDYGSVHFVMLSTEHDVTPGSHQYRWLEQHLEGIDRCLTPWLVVGMHRPMYVVHPHKSNRIVAEHLRASLESLFNQYNVDLVVSGHVHSYARTCNVYDEQCVDNLDKGTTHVTLGCGGHKLSDIDHDQYDWLDYSETKFGYGRVTADGDHSLRLEYITTDDGDIRDTVTLHNDYDGHDYCRGHGHRRYNGIQPAGEVANAQAASQLTASQ